MKHFLSILIMTITLPVLAQDSVKSFGNLENLIGGTWVTKGKWDNGGAYHQEIIYEWALTKNIITAKTYDFIDSKQFDDSLRNYGIRAWDDEKEQIMFYDFNVFGGTVIGSVVFSGKDIYYQYEYNYKGKTELFTDAWIYRDENTYDFKVGILKNGVWENVFLSSIFNRIMD